MYKKMLVLLDGSRLSEVVFSYAGELAGRLNLSIDLLHVCKPEDAAQLSMREAYIEHMAEMLASKTVKNAVQARGYVVTGYPADEILQYAHNNSMDLIMLATHGSSGIRRWGLGSVADKVVHEAEVPIWLVPAQLHENILHDSFPERSILVPLDGSRLAESVLYHVRELVTQRGEETEVLLVNVAKKPALPTALGKEKDPLIGENLAALKTRGEVYLADIVKQLKAEEIPARAEQLIGNPAEEIVRYAAQNHPRLIVMSTHGRSGFSRCVFGSVAENVLHRLQKTPLFLIRPDVNSISGQDQSGESLTEIETDDEDRDQ